MPTSNATQLRFVPSAAFTIRADFAGGGLSSDLGPLLLRGINEQIGLTSPHPIDLVLLEAGGLNDAFICLY